MHTLSLHDALPISLRTEGEAAGVKLGGILVQLVNVVTINCKPSNVPEALTIDVTELETNSTLLVKDIELPDDVEMITAEDIAAVSVQEPKKEEEVAEEILEEGEEGEEGESAEESESQESSSDSGDKKASDGDEKSTEETKE